MRPLLKTLALALVCVGLCGCFKVGSDARALRDSLMKSAAAEWHEEIEIGVGALTLNLARFGLSFVDLDPEARTALEAARSADVGVYRRSGRTGSVDRVALLSTADEAMAARGWDRAVAVVNERELVVVYVPKTVRSPRDVKVCVAVLGSRELVVASARSNLEPLLDLVASHSEWGRKGRALVQR